jgi:hypothetical protein
MRPPDDITAAANALQLSIKANKHPLLPAWVGQSIRLVLLELDEIRRRLPGDDGT